MENIILAIKQLLENAIIAVDSPLAEIKQVYFGDPINIPEKMLPVITIQPISDTFTAVSNCDDEKISNIEVKVIFNQKDYYANNQNSAINISNAVYSANKITYTTSTAHGLSTGDTIQVLGIDPTILNGTFFVTSIIDTTNFEVSKSISTAPVYSSGGTVKKNTDDIVYIVQKATRMAEQSELVTTQITGVNSVCGTIRSNPSLPLTIGASTYHTAQFARTVDVSYTLNPDSNRTYSTFEIIFNIEVITIGNRGEI